MKKLLPLIFCLLLLTGCARAYDGPTETAYVISEYTTEHYSLVTDFVETERTVYAYDSYGNIAQTMQYRNGRQTAKTVLTYDDRGNPLTETEYALDGWLPRRTRRIEYAYDEQNRLISERHDQNGSRTELDYVFDDEARTRTQLTGGEVTQVIVYDEAQNVLSEKTFLQGGGWHLIEYTRNPQGQPLTCRETNSDGDSYFTRYEYDDHGNAVFWEILDNGEHEIRRQEHEYDDQGRFLALYDVTEDGIRVEKSRREYLDENGSYTTWRGSTPSHTVILDEQGHEIELRHYLNGTDQVGIRQVTVYRAIQVPAGKEENP